MKQAGQSPQTGYTNPEQLGDYFRARFKPGDQWQIGLEYETFLVRQESLEPVPLEGSASLQSLFRTLEAMQWRFDPEALKLWSLRGGKLSLEPGGQVEISTAPNHSLPLLSHNLHADLNDLRKAAGKNGLMILPMGFHPTADLDAMPRVPNPRYDIMRGYMPKCGERGLDMMHRCASLQLNLDFSDEADLIEKYRVALALQPVATALFANSPLKEGQPTGYQSYRSRVWQDTDPDRCGMPDFIFEDGMSLSRYVDYTLDVPLYSIRDGSGYLDVTGASFRDYLNGSLAGYENRRPSVGDWEDHLNSLMPDVRLKRVLELRATDTVAPFLTEAYMAFWMGLLYEPDSRRLAWQKIQDWDARERHYLQEAVPIQGLQTPFRGDPLSEWLQEFVRVARAGLQRLQKQGRCQEEELMWLARLEPVITQMENPATGFLTRYAQEWKGDLGGFLRSDIAL